MARPDSWMPVYWGDLWNDTRDLTAVEQCAYYNLLGSMWMGGGSLPNDNDRLQRMSRVTEKEWRTVNATVTAYFDRGEDGRLYQKRLTEEYAKAMKAYAARSQHMTTVNSKRTQSPSTVTVTTTEDTTHNSHTPDGVADANASGGKPPKRLKGNRLALDWKPDSEGRTYAHERGLTDAETDGVAEQFREYWCGADCPRPLKKDWPATWRRWVIRAAPEVLGRRTRSRPNAPRSASPTAARDSILAKAGVRREGRVEVVPLGDGAGLGDLAGSTAGYGPIIEGHDWREVSGSADGTEAADAPESGDHGRSGGADGGVPQAADGVPGGRCELRADDSIRPQPVVAGMGGTEGAVRDAHVPQAHDAPGDDLDIPACLRRTA